MMTQTGLYKVIVFFRGSKMKIDMASMMEKIEVSTIKKVNCVTFIICHSLSNPFFNILGRLASSNLSLLLPRPQPFSSKKSCRFIDKSPFRPFFLLTHPMMNRFHWLFTGYTQNKIYDRKTISRMIKYGERVKSSFMLFHSPDQTTFSTFSTFSTPGKLSRSKFYFSLENFP